MNYTVLRNFAGSLLLLIPLSACTPIDGTSLLTDQRSDPTQHIVNKDPLPQELMARVHTTSIPAAGRDLAEISGDCYPSTYSDHRLEFSRMNGNTATPIQIYDLNAASATLVNVAKCKSGRFSVGIPAPSTGYFSYRVQIIGKDGSNDVTNAAQGKANFSIQF
ncbi:hypothetical protein BDW_07520 [Bdellovibrio bacteriovorus W]|nr:hypothetical protein BDW_07520 [Bdellovibrio bacteriovorus W]